jgi:predicted nucleotidyltransferase
MVTPILTRDLESVRQIILDALRGYRAKVWLFGSQATGRARLHSDIDVAILPLESLPKLTFFNIRDALEESDVVRMVDVVDLSEVDEKFRERVMKEGILWEG